MIEVGVIDKLGDDKCEGGGDMYEGENLRYMHMYRDLQNLCNSRAIFKNHMFI